jgi:hypothetical protein
MRLPRPPLDLLPAGAVALSALVIGGLIFGFFLVPYPVPVGFDEGYMVSFAERLIDGHWLPYVDGVSHRGPALYWILAVVQLLTGRYEWVGIRVVGLLGCSIVVAATFLAGVAARRPLAGAVGGALYVFLVAAVYPPGPGVGVHGEPVAAPCLAGAFFLMTFALERARSPRRRLLLLALAGAITALASMVKQTTGVVILPLLVWVLAAGWVRPPAAEAVPPAEATTVLARLMPSLVFMGGWLVAFLALVVWYAAHGALRELVYWGITYNSAIYMQPYRKIGRTIWLWFLGRADVLLGLLLGVLVAVARPLALVEQRSLRGFVTAYARGGFEITAGLVGVLLLLTAALPVRFWHHYFLPVFPFLGVVLGVVIELLAGGDRAPLSPARQAPLAILIIAVLLAGGGQRFAELRQQRSQGGWESPRPDPICAHIDKYAKPDEAIFIWGFDGDLYITCRRRPAARYTYLTMVAGVVPPVWNEARPERVALGVRDILRADLERSKPPVIVDVPLVGFPMDRVPELAALLARDYCPLPTVTGKRGRAPRFYGRRDRGLCP